MARKGIASITRQDTRPTCNPCQEDDHGRCATVLGEAYLGATDSTFPCRCYHGDPEGHQTACDERQTAYAEGRQEHQEISLSYGAASRREYQRWAEEM